MNVWYSFVHEKVLQNKRVVNLMEYLCVCGIIHLIIFLWVISTCVYRMKKKPKKVGVLMDSVVNEKVLHAKQESRSLLEYLCV